MTNARPAPFLRWGLLTLVSAIFFVATGGAFSTLGVLLPSMMSDLGWSWTAGGAGFTTLALMTGLSSTLPAYTIGKAGMKALYASGGAMVAAGFAGLALTQNFTHYLIAAGLVGAGYSQIGAVGAVKLLSGWFVKRRSFAISVFFTAGALGSVAGPLAARAMLAFVGSWRLSWLVLAIAVFVLCLITAAFIREGDQSDADTASDSASGNATTTPPSTDAAPSESADWTLGEALRNPQYYIIITALTVTLLGAVTMNTWQVTHMQNLGVSGDIAAAALSAHALFNALSRAMGGVVIDRIGAKWMLASGLGAGVIGMAALAEAKTPMLIALYAIGDGYSFGIVTFASTILLLNYYGVRHNPAILGVMNLASTAAMIGPIAAGRIGDNADSFSIVFFGISILMFIPLIAVLLMGKPRRKVKKS